MFIFVQPPEANLRKHFNTTMSEFTLFEQLFVQLIFQLKYSVLRTEYLDFQVHFCWLNYSMYSDQSKDVFHTTWNPPEKTKDFPRFLGPGEPLFSSHMLDLSEDFFGQIGSVRGEQSRLWVWHVVHMYMLTSHDICWWRSRFFRTKISCLGPPTRISSEPLRFV